jgi:MoaA/NifB/PqqE/SkfB family radical SAM enzyme
MGSINYDKDRVDGIRKRIKAIEEIDNYSLICPTPKSVKIELASMCNLKCSFCYNQYSKRKSLMALEDYKNIIQQLVDLRVQEVGLLFLGESTLNPNLVEMIKIAKQLGVPYVFLTTNGVLVKDQLMRDVVDSGLDSLKWSINHYSRDKFLNETGVDAFDTVVDNIKKALQYVNQSKSNLSLYASSTVYDVDNVDSQMKQFVDEHVKPYVREHYYFNLNNQGGLIKDEHFNIDSCNRLPVVPCPRIFNNSYITSDMKVACCCSAFTDDFIVGDLRKNSFSEIWNDETMINLRRSHLDHDLKDTICCRAKKSEGAAI